MSTLILLFIGAIAVLFIGVGKNEKTAKTATVITLILALVSLGIEWYGKIFFALNKLNAGWLKDWMTWQELPGNQLMLYIDHYVACPIIAILIIATLFIVALFKPEQFKGGDLMGLMLFSLCGGIMLASYASFVMMFLGIEVLSIPLYVLAGSLKNNRASNEAAMKYFIMGALSTAIFLLGLAFLYGSSKGALDIYSLRSTLGSSNPGLMKAGILIVLAALTFKMGGVPFHFWSPDVYEGSPSRSTAFMSTVAKIAAVVAFVRLTFLCISPSAGSWIMVVAIFSVLSVLLGNISAYRQSSAKRVLAYSSIAHVGYFLIGFLFFAQEDFTQFTIISSLKAIITYSFAYSMASLLVFYVIHKIETRLNRPVVVEDFKGLFASDKLLGLSLVVGLFSLAGIPLTAGFAGKLQLFSAGWSQYWWVIIVALLGTAISIAYYFRFIKYAVSNEGIEKYVFSFGKGEKLALIIAVLLILIVGIMPSVIHYPMEYFNAEYMKLQQHGMGH